LHNHPSKKRQLNIIAQNEIWTLRNVSETGSFHKFNKNTVKRVKQHFAAFIADRGLMEDFSSERKVRRSTALDDSMVAGLHYIVDQDPRRSMR
jgi:hypothetical protein